MAIVATDLHATLEYEGTKLRTEMPVVLRPRKRSASIVATVALAALIDTYVAGDVGMILDPVRAANGVNAVWASHTVGRHRGVANGTVSELAAMPLFTPGIEIVVAMGRRVFCVGAAVTGAARQPTVALRKAE